MDEAEARTIVRAMIRVMAILDDSLNGLVGRLDDASYAAYKEQVANLMGSACWDVLADIYKQYPHLEARDANAWREAGGLNQPYWLTDLKNTGKEA